MQDVQQLALVLVQTLYLHVEDGTRIDLDAVLLLDVLRQTHLVAIFDVHELLLCLRIVGIDLEFFNVGQIGDPLVADVLSHPVCQQRVAVQQETALCDTVRLVVELLRHHLVEITQLLLLQDLRMEARHAIDRIAADDGQMSHAYLAVVDDGHAADLILTIRIAALNL